MNISATTANQLITEKSIAEPLATYHEKKVGKNLYRVTSLYQGELDLSHALEDLIVNKILVNENMDSSHKN